MLFARGNALKDAGDELCVLNPGVSAEACFVTVGKLDEAGARAKAAPEAVLNEDIAEGVACKRRMWFQGST